MAYNSGSFFGGYPGGYSQTPEALIIPSNTNPLGPGFPPGLGANLPNVDPNAYPGTVHYGPSIASIGPTPIGYPANTGYTDPNLAVYGAPNFNGGLY